MFLIVAAMSGQVAFATEMGKKNWNMKMMTMTMTTEQRQNIANAHEKMAVCLRSNRPTGECHNEMMSSRKEGLGWDGCPAMGEKWGNKTQHHMMDDSSDDKE